MACWHGRWAGSLDTSVLLGTCGSSKHKVGTVIRGEIGPGEAGWYVLSRELNPWMALVLGREPWDSSQC